MFAVVSRDWRSVKASDLLPLAAIFLIASISIDGNLLNLPRIQIRQHLHRWFSQLRSSVLLSQCVIFATMTCGCHSIAKSSNENTSLPTARTISREQLVFHSNFYLPKRHRLVEELLEKRDDLAIQLQLPPSDKAIDIFLFEDNDRFRDYMQHQHPSFPDRRAFFLKSSDDLTIYAHWNSRVAEDLRHEVTHGYLHSVIPDVPIWLDEGIAEYFEVPKSMAGLNSAHAYYLQQELSAGRWQPDLVRLETLGQPGDLSQLDYAEAWLWVHYLLTDGARTRKVLHDQLARLRMSSDAPPLQATLSQIDPDAKQRVIAHLQALETDPQ